MSQQSLEAIYAKKAQKGHVSAQSKLFAYGREKGFDTFLNRKLIWPLLLGIDVEKLSNSVYEWDEGESSSDNEQIQLDAKRSLSNMKTFESISKFHLQKKQTDVLKILNSFFIKNPSLRYIQGFHDVASIFLILFGNSPGYYLMEKAGKTYFRDFLTKDLQSITKIISGVVLDILVKNDPRFQQCFQCYMEANIIAFIVPWFLTWFSHVFTSVKVICRVWDYILCTGPHGIIYLCAGIILSTKERLFDQCKDFDLATIQEFYHRCVSDKEIDIEKAINISIKLEKSIPIQTFPFDANSIYLDHNFQFEIPIHRIVRQHDRKRDARQKAIIKGTAVCSSILLVGGLLYLKHSKRV